MSPSYFSCSYYYRGNESAADFAFYMGLLEGGLDAGKVKRQMLEQRATLTPLHPHSLVAYLLKI